MSLLDSASEFKGKVNDLLKAKVDIPFTENDFPLGFLITEILSSSKESGEKIGRKITLAGNMLPEIPFTTGGNQRVKKDFYAGSNEPVVHILGAEENDLVVNGKFKSKRYDRSEYRNIPDEYREELELMRERGNIVKIELGEYKRYCILAKTKFDMNTLPDISYQLTFLVIGYFYPENARFINETKELPKNTNSKLVDKASEWNKKHSNIPKSVPQSIGDKLNSLTSAVAGAVSTVTGFVDNIITTYNDVQKSVTRAKGLITHAQQKLRNYRDFCGSIDPFNSSQALSGKYTNAKYYNSQVSESMSMIALLEKLRSQLSKLTPNLPLGRHIVKSGDTLQKISIKFYGNQDSWKKIYDYNNLQSTELSSGVILEIPRI